MLLDDGRHRRELTLDRVNLGVYMPAMIWGMQQAFSSDAMLLVFASEYYDPNDYIQSYDEFRTLVAKAPGEWAWRMPKLAMARRCAFPEIIDLRLAEQRQSVA